MKKEEKEAGIAQLRQNRRSEGVCDYLTWEFTKKNYHLSTLEIEIDR